jgi:hypothetical protein
VEFTLLEFVGSGTLLGLGANMAAKLKERFS